MFEAKRAVKTALSGLTLNGIPVEVINSSWSSTRKEHALPSFIVDFDHIEPSERTEDNEVYSYSHVLNIACNVPLFDVADEDAENNLEALAELAEQAIKAVYGGNYQIQDWYPKDVPYGKTTALCGAFAISITI